MRKTIIWTALAVVMVAFFAWVFFPGKAEATGVKTVVPETEATSEMEDSSNEDESVPSNEVPSKDEEPLEAETASETEETISTEERFLAMNYERERQRQKIIARLENRDITLYVRVDDAPLVSQAGEAVEVPFAEQVQVSKRELTSKEEQVDVRFGDLKGKMSKSDLLTAQEFLDENLETLVWTMHHEAGGTFSEHEVQCVGEVLMNRVTTDFRDFRGIYTLEDALDQPGQYPGTASNVHNRVGEPAEYIWQVAEDLLLGNSKRILPVNALWQTGFIPSFAADVYLVTDWHYYSVPSEQGPIF